MKKYSRNAIYLVLTGLFFLIAACAKDKGYYANAEVDKLYEGSIYDYLKSKKGIYDSLIKVIDRVGLQETLQDSTITLFALTNSNFQLAVENLNNTLSTSDKPLQYLNSVKYDIIDSILCQYIIRGMYPTDSLQTLDGIKLSAIRYGYPMHASVQQLASSGYVGGGPRVIKFFDTKGSIFTRNWVSTETGAVNLKAKNGFVHVVNPDHVFGFDKFVRQVVYIPPPENLFRTVGGTPSVSKDNENGPASKEGSLMAFDGNRETKFYMPNPGQFWMQFEFVTPTIANSYTLMSANDSQERDPTDWTLMGSNDLSEWILLDRRSDEKFDNRFSLNVYYYKNTTPYKYYRLNIARMRNSGAFQLAEWTMGYSKP
ncbi:ATP/GTP-binding protein [Sphingobacterium sp. Mn56C]|uniref:ATP/GTP-binding protein n=1 Tax=Sphingobacterium sp. Mn56C TaxID=3395261 RepID=UPI003BD1E68B